MHRIQTLDNRFAADTVVPPEWLNSLQEEICNVIEYAGLRVNESKGDIWTQLNAAIRLIKGKAEYDYVVATQEDFNYLIERQGANHYHIKDAYKSVYFKYKASGYLCYGTGSFLQSSDTWGYIQTNLCTHLIFEEGAYFNSGIYNFHIEVNTDDCRLDNVYIKGSTAGAGASENSFLLNAYRVIYNNCKVSDRLVSNTLSGFQGSVTTGHNITSKYINCTVNNILCNTAAQKIYGFYNCYNLLNCSAIALDTSGGGGEVRGFNFCVILNNCIAYNFDTGNGVVDYGFIACTVLSNCYSYIIDSTTSESAGFASCNIMSSCYANDIDASGAGAAVGFDTCSYMSACQSNDIDSGAGSAYGFFGCTYGSALYTTEAANAGNNWIDTNDAAIVNQYSCPAVFT